MTLNHDVSAICGKLTKAQREALATLSHRPLCPKASGSALMALWRKGLARNGWSSLNGNTWSITETGLAVRAALMEEQER